jgi:hypothetical protein
MNSLLGMELPAPVNFIIAFVVVLVLIGAATWLVRRFGVTRLDAAARGRQPRLAVIDAAAVDGRRKLVIIRRDNVEHLLMIGGPTDVVIETNIVRVAAAAREAPASRANGGADTARAAPLPDPTPWPLQPEPAPAPPVHPARADRIPRPAADDPGRWADAPIEPPAGAARTAARPVDPLAGLASELSRPIAEPPGKPYAVATEPPLGAQGAVSSASQGGPAPDGNLAEMAQRLEAALRRPATGPRFGAENGAVRGPAPELKPAAREPKIAMIQPKASTQPKGSVQPKSQPASQQSANLEQEMASLLGRPGKT